MIFKYKDYYYTIMISVLLIAAGFFALSCINSTAAFIFIAISLIIFLLFVFITYKRIKEVHEMSDYISHISNGEYDLDIKDNKEGELSILKNNLYKIIVTLRSQQELLCKDKNYLADSLADISHQLKTPITSITMMTDLLKNETDEEKRREFTEVINSQLSRVNWLIVTLLKLSKIDAGVIEFENTNESLKDILDDSVKPFMLSADVKGIALHAECSDDIFVDVDKNWYTEAISNIVKNCIEHTNEGGYVKVHAYQTPIFTKIVIRDNGTGIAPEDLPHIFERFYQGKNHSEASVGIGLALSKSILNKQNSIIDVKSAENSGTEFEITYYKVIV